MFQPWRRKIRAAERAYKAGRLEQAGQVLRQDDLAEYLPGQKLSVKVAAGMVERAKHLADQGHTSAGWRNLEQAAALDAQSEQVVAVRDQYLTRGIEQIERLLEADELETAAARLDRLGRRHAGQRCLVELRQVVERLTQAHAAARRGEFAEAESSLASAQALRPDWPWFQQRLDECRLKRGEQRRLADCLHRALAAEDWTATLAAADELLEIVPDNRQARTARRRAWAAVGVLSTRSKHPQQPASRKRLGGSTRGGDVASSKQDTSAGREPGERFLVWIDAVGGYLVCLGDEIVLGPPAPGAAVDVPILADLSHRHAVIRREAEGYLIQPLRSVKLDGRPISEVASLVDGTIIQLGESVELRFRKPHALSGTARLEFVSAHRTQPSADAVLLMAESCVLGPGWHSHVVCRHWQDDLVLFRQGGQLTCRAAQPYQVNGEPCEGQTTIDVGTQIEGEDFSLSLEAI